MKLIKYILIGLFLVCGSASLFAAEKSFEVSIQNRTLRIGEATYLNLKFDDTNDIPVPQLGDINGFQTRYSGPSTQVSIVNGKTSKSITHMFVLIPQKTGTFNIGPFTFAYRGDEYKGNAVTIQIVDAGSVSKNKDQKKLDDYVFVEIETSKESVYLNEEFDVFVTLYINNIGLRNVQYPKIETEGLLLEEFKQPKQGRQLIEGVSYDVIRFSTKASASREGSLKIGPAVIDADMLVRSRSRRRSSGFGDFDSLFGDFFNSGSLESLTLESKQKEMRVLALPNVDVPQDYSGAIGEFSFRAMLSPRKVKAGDPVTLTCEISGRGNKDIIKDITLADLESDFKIYDPQIKRENGTKVFEYVLIPKHTSIKEFPQISFSFFNTRIGKYSQIPQGPFPLEVMSPDSEEKTTIIDIGEQGEIKKVTQQEFGKDIIYIKEKAKKFHKSIFAAGILFWLLQSIPLILLLLFRIPYAHRQRLKTDTSYAKSFKAPKLAQEGLKQLELSLKNSDSTEFFSTLSKTLQDYISYKLNIPVGSVDGGIVLMLKKKGLNKELCEKLKSIFELCDVVRFSGKKQNQQEMADSLDMLKKLISVMEKKIK